MAALQDRRQVYQPTGSGVPPPELVVDVGVDVDDDDDDDDDDDVEQLG